MEIDVSQVTGFINNKVRPWPWRTIAIILTVSFTIASAVSTLVGYLVMGQTAVQTTSAPQADTALGWSKAPTLTKSQVDKVLERNLFNSEGTMGDASPTTEAQGTKATKTTLPIKVVGIIYGGNPFAGLAMVENTEKRTVNSFLVGDILAPEATVKEVHVDQILIDNQGREEFALLEEPEIRRSTRQGKKVGKTPVNANLGGSGYATEAPPDNFKEEGFERKGHNIEMTQEYKNRLLTVDFANVLQDAKASPNLVDGVLKGWRMDRIRKGSIYEKAGIQNGDVIEEINGSFFRMRANRSNCSRICAVKTRLKFVSIGTVKQ